MFEALKLLGSSEKSIALQTRVGRDIANLIELEPGYQQVKAYERLLERHGAKWRIRKPPTGIYNCAGHVWASRRTSILDPREWQKIIADDGYRPLGDGESPMPDDIVAYVDRKSAEIIHLARIIFLADGLAGSKLKIPWAASKWNSTAGETCHSIFDAPYDLGDHDIRYLTDRPL